LDLTSQLSSTENILKNLKSFSEKEKAIRLLENIKLELKKLQQIAQNYDTTAIEENASITSEILEEQKTLYLQYREWSNMDID